MNQLVNYLKKKQCNLYLINKINDKLTNLIKFTRKYTSRYKNKIKRRS